MIDLESRHVCGRRDRKGKKGRKTISRKSQRKSIMKMRKVLLFPEKLFDHETAAKERFQLQLHKEKISVSRMPHIITRERFCAHHRKPKFLLFIFSARVRIPHSHRLRRSVEKSRADDMGILFNLMNWSAGNVVIMPIFLHYFPKMRGTHTYELNSRIAWLTLFTSGCNMSILSADVSLERRNLMKFAKNKVALLFINKWKIYKQILTKCRCVTKSSKRWNQSSRSIKAKRDQNEHAKIMQGAKKKHRK